MTFKQYIKNNHIHLTEFNLDLTSVGLTDIYGIEEFTNLYILRLGYNNIIDIEPLKNLICLEHLDLDNNNIENVEALSSLINLDILYLSFNKIKNIDSLKNLKNLTQLTINDNKIKDITPLKYLVDNIEYLDVYNIEIDRSHWISEFFYKPKNIKFIKYLTIEHRKKIINML